MTRRDSWVIGLTCACVVGLAAGTANAAEGPLLVVVEAPPKLSVDAGEIRRAIGAELRDATVAPARLVSETADRALIVSVEHDRITMSLRDSATTPVIRTIPAPADPTARLRAIAWLGGNLARDQVSGIVADPVPPPPPAATEPPPAPVTLPAAVPAAPPPPERSSIEAPTATVRTTVAATPARPSNWTIGVAAGPAMSLIEIGRAIGHSPPRALSPWDTVRGETLWRVEARHQTDGSQAFLGVVLEGMANTEFIDEVVGAMALTGSARQWHRFSFQATFGAGIDLNQRIEERVSSPAGGSSTSYDYVLRPGLFAAGSLAVSHPLLDVVDWVIALDAHLSVVDYSDRYLAATLGLRYRF